MSPQVRNVDGNKAYKAEHSFMLEFNSQHTSVSNALLRHDRQARAEDIRNNKESRVSAAKVSLSDLENYMMDIIGLLSFRWLKIADSNYTIGLYTTMSVHVMSVIFVMNITHLYCNCHVT